MSFILEGTINGMRAVSGEVTKGKNAGTFWHFVSLEVCDSRFGQVYSCQIRSTEKDLFKKYLQVGPGTDKNGKTVEVAKLTEDLSGHNVKLLIKGLSAGERTVSAPAPAGNGAPAPAHEEVILQVRLYVAGLKDLGLPKTDDF